MTVERVIGIEPTTTTLATLCSTTELHPLGFCRRTPLHNGSPRHGSIEKPAESRPGSRRRASSSCDNPLTLQNGAYFPVLRRYAASQ